MNKYLRGLTLFLCLVLAVGALVSSKQSVRPAEAQTIPSRTPTPAGGGATATSEPGGPGPDPTAPPTSTSRPQQPTATSNPSDPPVTGGTVTATPFVLPATPEDGFLPTAQPCSLEVRAQSLTSNLNVRSGPGLDYDIVGNLLLNEVRPVIGRASDAAWWQIILADGVVGWVSDELVAISGYIGTLPEVAAPPIGSATVTPGTPWAPTPLPTCTPPATATAEATPTPEPTFTSAAQEATAVSEAGAAEATPTARPTIAPPATVALSSPEPPPTAAPLSGEEQASGSATELLIPIAGVVLIVSGAALFIARRNRA